MARLTLTRWLSEFKTEAKSEDSLYNESDSDDSEDDVCMDDTNVTASGSDSPSSLEGDLEAVVLVQMIIRTECTQYYSNKKQEVIIILLITQYRK